MKFAALTTEQKALLALCIAPVSVRDAGSVGGLNALANLTRKGMASYSAGLYSITAKGQAVVK